MAVAVPKEEEPVLAALEVDEILTAVRIRSPLSGLAGE